MIRENMGALCVSVHSPGRGHHYEKHWESGCSNFREIQQKYVCLNQIKLLVHARQHLRRCFEHNQRNQNGLRFFCDWYHAKILYKSLKVNPHLATDQ
jgi:hypothetical protein